MDQPSLHLPPDLRELLNHQTSPLRIHAQYRLEASPEEVFNIIGDLKGITHFFPMIHHASVEHAHGCAGEGSTRVCSVRGMGKVRERIVWWAPPLGYAYRADGPFVPLGNHLGLVLIQPDDEGGSTLEWRQYFHTRLGPLGWTFRGVMPILMDRAATNIVKLLRHPSPAVPAVLESE